MKYNDPENPSLTNADFLELRPSYSGYFEDKLPVYQEGLDDILSLMAPGGWEFYSAIVLPEQAVTGQLTPTEA
jgi:hypothetical protein